MSIQVGQMATIIAKLENNGEPVSGTIRMVETTGNGTLAWGVMETGDVSVVGEKTEAINNISGQSQCVISSVPLSISNIRRVDEDLNVITSGNLIVTEDGFYGRTLDLSEFVETGQPLLVDYLRSGTVVNYLTGVKAGTANVIVSADVNLEAGLSKIVTVEITAAVPVTPSSGSSGSYDVVPTTPPADEWYAAGPTVCKRQGYYDTTFGPWSLRSSSGQVIRSTYCNIQITTGRGWLQTNGAYLTVGPTCYGQTITLKVSGSYLHVENGKQISADINVNLTY
jgi:hypothetical protein